jgi:hypothetical protein
MESTQTGDLNFSQAQEALKGILGAKEPPKPEVPEETKAEQPQPEITEEEVKVEGEVKEEVKEADAQNTEEIQLESLEELAEATGLPLEKILNLKARTKVDGIEDIVPLAQLVKSYQLEGHLTRKSQELSEKMKSLETEREKVSSELNTRLTEANQLISHFEQQFMADYNNINWNELRQSDPAEFAARKQEYNEKWNNLQAYRQQIVLNSEKMRQEAQAKQQDQFRELLKTEEERLLNRIPDWKDEKKASEGKKELSGYLRDYGFNDGEISGIYDHRQIDIIRKAMLYDKISSKNDVAKKKVATLPKLLKPSAQAKDPSADALKSGFERLNKTGRVDDAAAVLKQMLKRKGIK